MNIYKCMEHLEENDVKKLIKKRLPGSVKENVFIVGTEIENSNFTNVAFYFEQNGKLPEIFYTHIYVTEINQYLINRSRE